MTDLRTAAQQALEFIKVTNARSEFWLVPGSNLNKTVTALCAALEQPGQEPVAFMYVGIKHDGTTHGPHLIWEPEYMDAMSAEKGVRAVPLYTHPPRREWRGLTDEEISDIFEAESRYHYPPICATDREFARAIEAALKERNV
jgi:hypothetical protein